MARRKKPPTTVATRKSAAAATLMARNNWPGDFRRAIRLKRPSGKKDSRGEEITEEYIDHTVIFPPGVPVEVDADELAVCQLDIGDGKPLVYVEYDERGKPRMALEAGAESGPNQITELEQIISDQQDAIDQLIGQLKSAGIEPCVSMDDGSDSAGGGDNESDAG